MMKRKLIVTISVMFFYYSCLSQETYKLIAFSTSTIYIDKSHPDTDFTKVNYLVTLADDEIKIDSPQPIWLKSKKYYRQKSDSTYASYIYECVDKKGSNYRLGLIVYKDVTKHGYRAYIMIRSATKMMAFKLNDYK